MNIKHQFTLSVGNDMTVSCSSVEEAAKLIKALKETNSVQKKTVERPELRGKKNAWLDSEVKLLYELISSGVKPNLIKMNDVLLKRHTEVAISVIVNMIMSGKYKTINQGSGGVLTRYKKLELEHGGIVHSV